jgi:integrase
MARLLVRTAIESGLRWGELTELRTTDLDTEHGTLTVSRSVVELRGRHTPGMSRFHVKPYPKNRRFRRLSLRPTLVDDLAAFITARHLAPGDLIFATAAYYQARLPHHPAADPDDLTDLGWTEPAAKGRRYRHGTAAGYGAGRCRCPHCRDAVARYRADRRAEGLDRPPQGRHTNHDGHLAAGWFRNKRWYPAVHNAGIDRRLTLHDLRHAHASWILEGGASLEVVRERLGHSSIVSTSRYLHTLPHADQTALTALDHIYPTP